MVRWACRDERLADVLGRGPADDEALPGVTLTGGVRGGAEVLALVLDRRKFRAGDDGEVGAGSGASHTNEAADTVGSAGGDAGGSARSAPNMVASPGHPVPVEIDGGSSARRGSGSGVANADDKASSFSVHSSPVSGVIGTAAERLKVPESLGVPIVSAGSAGTSSAAASFSSTAGPPLAELPLAELPLARTSLAAAAA